MLTQPSVALVQFSATRVQCQCKSTEFANNQEFKAKCKRWQVQTVDLLIAYVLLLKFLCAMAFNILPYFISF